jgi:hypothetical protein
LAEFDKLDTDETKSLSLKELKPALEQYFIKEKKNQPAIRAEVAGKIILHLVGGEKAEVITRDQVESLANDIARLASNKPVATNRLTGC